MSRIIAIIIAMVALCGCSKNAEQEIIENGSICITHHEYHGHQYLRFKDFGYGSTYVHDPDCTKCKNKKECEE